MRILAAGAGLLLVPQGLRRRRRGQTAERSAAQFPGQHFPDGEDRINGII